MKLSVVIPCYKSEATIEKLVRLTQVEFAERAVDCEFILVNDGSPDDTFSCIERLAREFDNVIGVDLMRNFGQHNAILAGLHQVSGDAVMLMDDDMQTHPSQCHILWDAYVTGNNDVVFAKYHSHKKSFFRELGTHFAMATERAFAGCPKDIEDTSFFVMSRTVSDELIKYQHSSVYVQGLIFRITKRIGNVEVQHFARENGKSGYTLSALIHLWSTILNFSITPLRLAVWLGVLVGGAGIIGAIVLLVSRLTDPTMQLGWASQMVTTLICSGAIMLCLGLIGEYVGRLFMFGIQQPQFIVRNSVRSSEESSNAKEDEL